MMRGMTLIVRNVVALISPFVVLYGAYVICTGHLAPGGGFAGGVILMGAVVMLILAFGRSKGKEVKDQNRCHVLDGLGSLGFALVALLGFAAGGFFVNFLPPGRVHEFLSGGTILGSNLAIGVKVGAGLAGVFLALVVGCRQAMFKDINPSRSHAEASEE